ncbi:MAG TPA: hypothetical protein PKJ08_04225, partial [Candidatus Cloacimonadota bacterium]|nr:hypothetical protein [Candidatus Cloacimonadota bacterium]
KILIIVYSNIVRDARVLKQLSWLNNHKITLLSFGKLNDQQIKHISIEDNFPFHIKLIGCILLKLKLYLLYYWLLPVNRLAFNKLQNTEYDLIIANDIYTLPLAIRIQNKAKLLYDAHEYYPREHDNNKQWMFFFHDYMNYLTQRYAPKAEIMLTIGQAIANEYHKHFKLNPNVIMNMPQYSDIEISNNDKPLIRMVHHGVALPGRNIELMIEVVKLLGHRYSLDFYLLARNEAYLAGLKDLTSEIDNIHIHDPLDIDQIIPVLNTYDVGFYFLKSDSFNDIYCLPNKLFDFIQARLAVIIGPSPEMKRIVEQYECGFATSNFEVEQIVKEIRSLTKADIQRFKENAHIAAQELNAETSKKIFLSLIEGLK